jgi:AcrR family transcriptional regulator
MLTFRNSRSETSGMTDKTSANQQAARRAPQQARAHHKIGLILEAAMRVLESGGMAALTTNAVAATAGVSIGTLYQYFHDKQAILDALIERELGGMADKVMQALKSPAASAQGDRVREVVRAALSAYGGRNRVRRLLIAHSLASGGGTRLQPLYAGITALFASEGLVVPGRGVQKLPAAEAFVLAHAFSGVIRAMVTGDAPPKRQDVENALVKLVANFMGPG